MCGSTEHPILRDHPGVGDCTVLQGGVKLPGAPSFTPVVDNVGDLLWREEDYALIDLGDGDTVVLDNAF